jgi:uncharacterized protein with von Willebrand factor type A (vWA) domain
MDRTLVDFVKVLRTAEIKVSPAETLDAMECMDLVGYENREFLKNSLALVLAKNPEEKEAFEDCFERFFVMDRPAQPGNTSSSEDESGGEDEFDDGDFNAEGESQQSGKGGGQGGGQGAGEQEIDDSVPQLQPTSELGKLLTTGTRTEQTISMMEAGRKVEVSKIVVFTQKGLFTRKIMDAMGLKGLQDEISDLTAHGGPGQRNLSGRLKKSRDLLRERVRDYVEKQFFLHADETGKQLREELLKKVKLSSLEKRNFKDVQEVVFTLRNNMQYDGMFFNLKWKASKVDRPKVMCICDVSGSVSNYSRFLLMFLYSLAEVLPKVRSFAFSSDLGEVTKLFQHSKLEEAMARTMRDYGNGSTDYGRMLQDFKNHVMDDVDNKTTIIILGDARNNYGDSKSEIVKEMYDKAKRVIWLNPEPKSSWTVGDAEMKKYAPCCHQTEVCNSLVHLERVVSNLLKSVS